MKIKSRNILSLTMVIILIFAFFAILYKNIIEIINTNLSITIEERKTEQFEEIWEYTLSLQAQAKLEVSRIASNIESDILSLPEDEINLIKHDMDNNIPNNVYHSILLNNILNYSFNGIDNNQNGIIIMNNSGYVEDFNYRRAGSVSESINSCREWDYSLNNAYNKELENDCIDKILNHTNGIIASEFYAIDPPKNHILISEFNHDTVLEVFMNEGIEGLQNYQIFVPYYITNVGDIFGTPDMYHGIKLNNHKIIVVLEFNLYDQLNNIPHEPDDLDDLLYRYNNLLRWMYTFGIAIVFGIVILSLNLCSVYNTMVLIETESDENKNDEVDIEDKNN